MDWIAGDGRGGFPKTNDVMIQMLYFAAINELQSTQVCRPVAAKGRTEWGQGDGYLQWPSHNSFVHGYHTNHVIEVYQQRRY